MHTVMCSDTNCVLHQALCFISLIHCRECFSCDQYVHLYSLDSGLCVDCICYVFTLCSLYLPYVVYIYGFLLLNVQTGLTCFNSPSGQQYKFRGFLLVTKTPLHPVIA